MRRHVLWKVASTSLRSIHALLTMNISTTDRQDNNARIRSYQSGIDHWRCFDCKLSVIYSCGSSGVDYNQLWQCCRCGFGMNSRISDDGCSYCATGFTTSVLAAVNPLQAALIDPFHINLGYSTSHNGEEESYAKTVSIEGMGYMDQVLATDDLSSTVNVNFLRFKRFEEQFEHTAEPQRYDEYGYLMPLQINEEYEFGDSTFTTGPSLDRYFDQDPTLTRRTNIAAPDLRHTSHPPIEIDAPMASMETDTVNAVIADSAYNTMLDGSHSLGEQHLSRKRILIDTKSSSPPYFISGDVYAHIGTHNERSPQEDSGELRLACPHFKHKPAWCTNKPRG
jgi:hypothetical protein